MGRISDMLAAAESHRAERRASRRDPNDEDNMPSPTIRSREVARRLVLTHLTGSKKALTQPFRAESILIGRGEHNDVSFDLFDDPTVSENHAEIRFENGHPILYDMGSLNGTFVNGQSIKRTELHDQDEIGLGKTGPRLRIDLPEASDFPPAGVLATSPDATGAHPAAGHATEFEIPRIEDTAEVPTTTVEPLPTPAANAPGIDVPALIYALYTLAFAIIVHAAVTLWGLLHRN